MGENSFTVCYKLACLTANVCFLSPWWINYLLFRSVLILPFLCCSTLGRWQSRVWNIHHYSHETIPRFLAELLYFMSWLRASQKSSQLFLIDLFHTYVLWYLLLERRQNRDSVLERKKRDVKTYIPTEAVFPLYLVCLFSSYIL